MSNSNSSAAMTASPLLGAVICQLCNGDGYTAEHDIYCDGSPNYCGSHCPVQVRCERCMGMGHFIKPGKKYHAHHKPTGEDWVILGVRNDLSDVCAAGWPPSIGKLLDCDKFEEVSDLSESELAYRKKQFGEGWL